MILRPSYLHNGISYTGRTTSLYWIGALLEIKFSTTTTNDGGDNEDGDDDNKVGNSCDIVLSWYFSLNQKFNRH